MQMIENTEIACKASGPHMSAIRNKARRILSIAMLVILMAACLSPAALAASFKAKINSSSSSVYTRPSTSGTRICRGVKGVTVTVTDYSDGWAKISYRGNTGYMQIKYLDLSSRITAYTEKKCSVYRAASSSSSKLGSLPRATAVYVIGMDGSYCRIQNKSGSVTGYIRTSELSTKKPSVEVESDGKNESSSSGDKTPDISAIPSSLRSTTSEYSSGMSKSQRLEYAIYLAQNQMGKPYSSDANPPSSFDCALLVHYCYDKAGFDIEDSSKTQGYDDSFEKIEDTDDLKRGDMVCFNTNSSDSDLSDHTGIYLGKGYFIHASSSAGKVMVSRLDEDGAYYNRTFSWGRRIG